MCMKNFDPNESTEAAVSDLVVALNELRDTLVDVSLLLQKLQIGLDPELKNQSPRELSKFQILRKWSQEKVNEVFLRGMRLKDTLDHEKLSNISPPLDGK